MVRVFVSSTWIDLQPEREAVERALHRMRGAEHLGMEYFGSRPETPNDASLEEVDRSDVYAGIFGFRYGSGITEAEYRRARERGLPCLIYIKDAAADALASLPESARDADPAATNKLAALKQELQRDHIVSTFTSPDDLATKVVADLHSHLHRSLPPPATAPERRHNLPASVDRFVGRERELARVREMIAAHRLVTLTGGGGAGKTRLALEAAQRVAAEEPSPFPDGIWLVELGSLQEPSLLPQTVAVTFGLREAPGSTYLDLLAEHLAPKTVLLLLDNCEHLVAECRRLVDRLLRASPGLRVLATSRALLEAPGEAAWRVPSLAVPPAPPPPHTPDRLSEVEAVVLFLERGRQRRPDLTLTPANAVAIGEICRRLDGIPLAIELAAARVRSLSPEQIAARLADRFRLLTGGTSMLPHQQTLQAALDWSHDLLTEPERVLLRRLAMFVGGWTLEAAEAVCADDLLPSDDVLDLLTALIDRSLVQADDDHQGAVRYRLLETVREYALAHLTASGETDAVRQRHAEWAVALAEEAASKLTGPDQGASLDRLAIEHDNLRGALQQTIDAGNGDQALRLGGALWRFWQVRGFFAEGRGWLGRALKLPADGRPASMRAVALSGTGNLAESQGDYPAARTFHEEALAIRREIGDRSGIAGSLNNLGNVAYNPGDYPAARTLHEESLAIKRELGDHWGISSSLNNLGNIAYGQGDYSAARALHEESLAIFRELGDRSGIAYSLNNLGNVAHDQGNYPATRVCYEESLAIRRELGDRRGIAQSLNNLGLVAWDQGDYRAARALHEESLAIFRQLGDRRGIALSLEGLAAVLRAEGRSEAATRLLGATDALRTQIGAPLPPADRAGQDESIAKLKAELGEEAFAAAWAAGQAMSLDEAVALALQQEPETT